MIFNSALSFDKNTLIFPVTWVPLQLLQMILVTQVAATEPNNYFWCSKEVEQISKLMRQYLFQFSICHEWHRVFMVERQLGFGVFLSITYFIAVLAFMITSASINGKVTLFMIPSFFAIIFSSWMNVVMYFNNKKIGMPFNP